jgi:hypothetical protein
MVEAFVSTPQISVWIHYLHPYLRYTEAAQVYQMAPIRFLIDISKSLTRRNFQVHGTRKRAKRYKSM